MLTAMLIVYGVVALASLIGSGILRDHANDTHQPLTFWQRNNVVLSAFWPLTLLLLGFDAAADYQLERKKRGVLALREVERELKEANDAIDTELQRPVAPRLVKGGKR